MKNTLTAITIALALGIFVVFWDSPPEAFLGRTSPPEAALSQANSYMINSETRKFNEQGQQTYILNTTQGQFFKRQNKFVMDNPKIRADSDSPEADTSINGGTPKQEPWHLSANTGVVYNQGDRIVMIGDVYAWQEAPEGKTQLKTTELTYYPDKDMAESDHKVYISAPGNRANGIGMKANFEQRTFQLLAQVKSNYDAVH